MSPSSTSGGGSPRNGSSRSSGGQNGIPSAAYTPSSSGASGNGSSASTYAREPVARTSSVPNRSGSATTSSTGTPSTVTPTARRSDRSTIATICGSRSKCSSTGSAIGPGAHDSELLVHVAPAPRIAGDLAAESLRDPLEQSARLVEEHPATRPRPLRLRQRGKQLRLGLRPDPRHLCQPPLGGRRAELVHRPHAQRTRRSRSRASARSPSNRPNPTSSGATSLSSSSSSAIRPVSTSSSRRASMPGPIPRNSRARPARTRSAIGAFVSRIISAARR